jgi:hypothetical protein
MASPKAAQSCPACGDALHIERLGCGSCGTRVEGTFRLPRLARLSPDSQRLVELLVLSSGNLKTVAKNVGVSYPTIRKRIDALMGELRAQLEVDERFRKDLVERVKRGAQSASDAAEEIESS